MHYLYVDNMIKGKEEELRRKDAELQEKDAELQEKDAELQEKDAELQETVRNMVFEAIQEKGELSGVLCEQIGSEKNICILKEMHAVAIKSKSVREFEEKIKSL